MKLLPVVAQPLAVAQSMSESFARRMADEVAHLTAQHFYPDEIERIMRQRIEQFEPMLASHLSDSTLAGWVWGADRTVSMFPRWLEREIFMGGPREPPPADTTKLYGAFRGEPGIKLVNIETAADRLINKRILTRPAFDKLQDDAKRQAFTIAGGLKEDTIARMRDLLQEQFREGTSLRAYRRAVEEHFGSSPIGAGHLENVYRTNIANAIRDGRASIQQHPVVKAVFPYQEYIPIHDARTRPEHLALGKLGLSDTGIYRLDDPFWDHFTPPWDYQCRCGTRMLTIDQAAAAGVEEAKRWMQSGRPPEHPDYRFALIPFEPNPGWGSRGDVGPILLSLEGHHRAPKGYTKDNPLRIAGKEFVGGMFIPKEVYQQASAEEKAKLDAPPAASPGLVKPLATRHLVATKDRHQMRMIYDPKGAHKGYYLRYTDPQRKNIIFPERYQTAAEAADVGARVLLARAIAHREFEAAAKVQTQAKPPAAEEAPKPPKAATLAGADNWKYTDMEAIYATGQKSKFRDNLAAMETLEKLKKENRHATKEEQAILSKFTGWGQFTGLLDPTGLNKAWATERVTLKNLIGDDAFESAQMAKLNSHFTAPEIVKAKWEMMKRLGFRGGKYLEPALGVGYYLGLMPDDLRDKTTVTGVEMDTTTGGIAKELYPDANIHVAPFQNVKTPENFYDLVATNVPFVKDIRVLSDKKWGLLKPLVHDYYFLRSIDTAKPGAIIAHITSTGTLDKLNPTVRKELAKHCEFISAMRFPGSTHKENAGTDVVTDLVILRKKNPAIPETTDEVPPEAVPKFKETGVEWNRALNEARERGETLGEEKSKFTGVTVDSLGRLYHWRDGVRIPAPDWLEQTTVKDEATGEPIRVNTYFAKHPEQILGHLDLTGEMYAAGMKNVTATDDFDKRLADAMERLPQNILQTKLDASAKDDSRVVTTDEHQEGDLVLKDGVLYKYENGALVPITDADEKPKGKGKGGGGGGGGGGRSKKPAKGGRRENMLALMGIQTTARALLRAEGEEAEKLRAKLNEQYDAYVQEFGNFHTRGNSLLLKQHFDAPFMKALELYDPGTGEARKADIFARNTINPAATSHEVKTVPDAAGVLLNTKGKIHPADVAQLLGISEEEAGKELVQRGIAFQDPSTNEWESGALYLSGYTREKLKVAREAAQHDPKWQANVDALEKSLPEDIPYDQISVRIGTPWVPAPVFQDFLSDTFGGDPTDYDVEYNGTAGVWSVNNEAGHIVSDQAFRVDAGDEWVRADKIVHAAFTGQPVTVWKTDGERRYVDKEATDIVAGKVTELRQRFEDWVWFNPQRKAELVQFYNDHLNEIKDTRFDGSHQTMPGMRTDFKLYPMQKDAVWRVVTTGRGLLAHEVGLGKTASMVCSAMELRRLGLSKKPCIGCLKANIEQITREAQELYPGAKILSLAGKFDKDKRRQTLNQIATGDWDMVIATHDNLNMMKMRPETMRQYMNEELEEIEAAIIAAAEEEAKSEQAGGRGRRRRSLLSDLQNMKGKLLERMKKALEAGNKDNIYFEDLGIDQLFIDEAHNYKSLPVYTRRGRVKGIPNSQADKATGMLARCRYLQQKNGNGRGVVFATGTPIANTMGELFNMQRFLQYDELKAKGLHRFDTWADSFGDIATRKEYKLQGDTQDTSRFSMFVNMPELRLMASRFMDVQHADDQTKGYEDVPEEARPAEENFTGETRDKRGYVYPWTNGRTPLVPRPKKIEHVEVCEDFDGMHDFMSKLRERALAMRGRMTPEEMKLDNMLKVCNDARLAALDLRLVDPGAKDHPDSKLNKAFANIMQVYNDNPGKVQAVFSNIGIHAKGGAIGEDIDDGSTDEDIEGADADELATRQSQTNFSAFEELKRKLVAAGIPESEIINFSDPTMKGDKRDEAQALLKSGKARIALGSTKTLGTGTNIQKNLYAIHHLDIPYVPVDIEQRNGRGYRAGNTNPEVHIYHYVQQNSADNVFWQIVANKTKFINQWMRGDKSARTMTESDSEKLSPDEMVAVASGDPEMIERSQLRDDIMRLERQKRSHGMQKEYIQKTIDQHPETLANAEAEVEKAKKSLEELEAHKDEGFRVGDEEHTDEQAAGEALRHTYFHRLDNYYSASDRPLATYRGMKVTSRSYDKKNRWAEVTSTDGAYLGSISFADDAKVIEQLNSIYRYRNSRVKEAERKLAGVREHKGKLIRGLETLGEWSGGKTLSEKQKRLNELEAKHRERLQAAGIEQSEPTQEQEAALIAADKSDIQHHTGHTLPAAESKRGIYRGGKAQKKYAKLIQHQMELLTGRTPTKVKIERSRLQLFYSRGRNSWPDVEINMNTGEVATQYRDDAKELSARAEEALNNLDARAKPGLTDAEIDAYVIKEEDKPKDNDPGADPMLGPAGQAAAVQYLQNTLQNNSSYRHWKTRVENGVMYFLDPHDADEPLRAWVDFKTGDSGGHDTELSNLDEMYSLWTKWRKADEAQAPAKLSIMPGTTRMINGVSYTLNQHHRWARTARPITTRRWRNAGQTLENPAGAKKKLIGAPAEKAESRIPPPRADRQPPPSTPPAPAPTTPATPPPAPAPAAPPPPAHPTYPEPPHEVRVLAASEGDSPQHLQARTHVAMHFFQNRAFQYNPATGKQEPLPPHWQAGMLAGIDLSKPVLHGPPPEIPPPDRVVQWQAEGGYRGSYFSTPGHQPEHLGIHSMATAWNLPGKPIKPRVEKVYDATNAPFNRTGYLRSTAAPTVDTWSTPGASIPVAGGGVQFYAPVASNPGVRIPQHKPMGRP